MANGAVIDTSAASAALGQGLKIPTDGRVETKSYLAGVGPKGEKVQTTIDEYYWDEVGKIARLKHEVDDDETWGITSKVNIGVTITTDPHHQNINPGRWVSNGFSAMKLAVKPYSFTDAEMKALQDDTGNPHQWAVMRKREGDSVLRLMAGLLKAVGRHDLLIGKKTFAGFSDPIVKMIDSEALIGTLVTVRIKSTINRQTGAREEEIARFTAA